MDKQGKRPNIAFFPGTFWPKQTEGWKTFCFEQKALNDGGMPVYMLGKCSLGNSKIQWFTTKTRQLQQDRRHSIEYEPY